LSELAESSKPFARLYRISYPNFSERRIDLHLLAKGCPDLVIWNASLEQFRFVEVKCPLWDRPSNEQNEFMAYARSRGVSAEIVEWVFEDDASAA
jgi:hypothetical protein